MSRRLLGTVMVLALAPAAAAALPPLPMSGRFVPPAPAGPPGHIILTGRVPTTVAGQRVTILGRECFSRFDRQVRLTQTRAGGVWEVTLGGAFGRVGELELGMAYRAVWRNRRSAPFWFRMPMRPSVTRSGDRVTARVRTASPVVELRGKTLILQRRSGDRWVDVRSARLTRVDAHQWQTTFVVATPGLTLRVVTPTRTARPCANSGASETFRS